VLRLAEEVGVFVIPMATGKETSEYSLMVVLEADNLERLQQFDPAEVSLKQLGGPWSCDG
jgi:hypothetical protein